MSSNPIVFGTLLTVALTAPFFLHLELWRTGSAGARNNQPYGGAMRLLRRTAAVMFLALLITAIAPMGSADAQIGTVFNQANTLVEAGNTGLNTIFQAVSVFVFLIFFGWALGSGRWDFGKLVGMVGAVLGFFLARVFVTGIQSMSGASTASQP